MYFGNSVKCRSGEGAEDGSDVDVDKYNSYYYWVVVAAVIYAAGVPALFWYLLQRFKPMGQSGDRVVRKALGWMCKSRKIRLTIPKSHFLTT